MMLHLHSSQFIQTKSLNCRCIPWYRIIPTTPGNAQKDFFFPSKETNSRSSDKIKLAMLAAARKKVLFGFSLFFFCSFKSEDCSVRS
jgi:hypothetical protein